MAGVDLLSISKLLGHQTLTMTMRYAHFSPGYLAQAVGKLVGFGTDTKTSTTVLAPPQNTDKAAAWQIGNSIFNPITIAKRLG